MHFESSVCTKPVSSSRVMHPAGHTVAQGDSVQCWQERRLKIQSTGFWPRTASRSLNVWMRRVLPFRSGGFCREPENLFSFRPVGDGRLFHTLQATWQPLQFVHREVS